MRGGRRHPAARARSRQRLQKIRCASTHCRASASAPRGSSARRPGAPAACRRRPRRRPRGTAPPRSPGTESAARVGPERRPPPPLTIARRPPTPAAQLPGTRPRKRHRSRPGGARRTAARASPPRHRPPAGSARRSAAAATFVAPRRRSPRRRVDLSPSPRPSARRAGSPRRRSAWPRAAGPRPPRATRTRGPRAARRPPIHGWPRARRLEVQTHQRPVLLVEVRPVGAE